MQVVLELIFLQLGQILNKLELNKARLPVCYDMRTYLGICR